MVNIEVNFNPQKDGALKDRIKRSTIINANPMQGAWNRVGRPTTPRVILSSDTPDFDPTVIDLFKDEGYTIAYLQYQGDLKAYDERLVQISESLGLGDKFAIVAYGDAAGACLKICERPISKLVSVIAFYPSTLPRSSPATFPPTLMVQIHLAGSQDKLIDHAIKASNLSPFSYSYPDSEPGFAEHDLDSFDKSCFRVSWSRMLSGVREGFGITSKAIDLESIWDNHTALEFAKKDTDATMATMVPEPYVNHVPTMTGGIGYKDLYRFYKEFFIPCNPPDTTMKLLSRTVGTDRIVDEMNFNFTHTTDMPWMLPGVPPTGKRVEVALVSIVCIRGGKLYHEHIYWDQASVLVQIGLLDPKLIPQSFKTTEEGREKDIKQLPVVGREGVLKVMDEEEGESNLLIPKW